MDTSWHGICTISIVHFMAYPETMKGEGPIIETVTKIAKDDFFTGIEITWIKDSVVRKEVRQIIDVSHLQVAYGAQPTLLSQKLDLNSKDVPGRTKAIDQIKQCIDEAHEIGATRLALLSGPDPGPQDREKALALLQDSMLQICSYGKPAGVGITLETFDDQIDKKCLIGPAPLAARFAKEVKKNFPDFGIMYDLSHQPLLNEKSEEALSVLKEHLAHIHVGNCVKKQGQTGYGDQHPRFGFHAGENDVPELTKFLRALFYIGYLKKEASEQRPFVGFEVKPLPGESSDLVVANAKRVWKHAWALV